MSDGARRLRRAASLALLAAALVATPAHAVVGGHPASASFPGMAALEISGTFACGASLVRERVVLTAAHCVTGDDAPLPAGDLVVQLGTSRRSAGGERIAVSRVVVHEDYGRPATSSSDVALLELERAPRDAEPFRVVSADERALWAAGRTATVLGWGGQSFPALLGATDDLMAVDVPIRRDSECAAIYAATAGWDPATMLCAGAGTGGRDSCQGDSGGPLVVADGGEPVVVGTVSFGLGCGFPGLYGVYARIGERGLAEWITRHAGPVRAEEDVEAALERALRVRGARREGRVLRLSLGIRRPLRDLRVSVSRVRGESRHIVARTRRTAPRGDVVARVRLPGSGPRRRLLIRLRATDAATGRRVAADRLLRTRG